MSVRRMEITSKILIIVAVVFLILGIMLNPDAGVSLQELSWLSNNHIIFTLSGLIFSVIGIYMLMKVSIQKKHRISKHSDKER